MLSSHQRRADELIDLVQRTAADLADIPFHAPEDGEAFADHHEPHWVASGRTETVIPFRPGALDWVLPGPLRRARLAGRLMSEAEVLVTRNVENLRWAMLRNLDDAFRRFGGELDDRLAMTLQATKGAMQAGLDRRRQVGEEIASEIERRQQSLGDLEGIRRALTQFVDPHDSSGPAQIADPVGPYDDAGTGDLVAP